MSPKKASTSRKRKSEPLKWKKNVRKRLRLSGDEHTSCKGTLNAARKVKPGCHKCRYKCNEKISEGERQGIFESYWKLDTYGRKRDFLCQSILEKRTNPGERAKRKEKTRTYTLCPTDEPIRVCKTFFLQTLDIGKKMVEVALKKKQSGTFSGNDQRGRHVPANKTSDEARDFVKKHILSFPAVESHYVRKNSNRLYLEPGLSVNKMYDLYKETCKNEKKKPVSKHIYRHIFCEEFNMSFHTPKKDQCMACELYKNKKSTNSNTTEDDTGHSQHMERKEMARAEKCKDKNQAATKSDHYAATFDLEAVLTTPCSLVSQVYYKRKLCSYNLSVYSLGDKTGTCYTWDETDGGRGSCEIGTCLLLHIKSLPRHIKHVCLYSDTCSGQNRNKFITAVLLYAVKYTHVNTIDHKFLESGHTHMECDSMHSAIEHAKKSTNIFIPCQWDTVIHMARRNKPYIVVPLKYSDILDLKTLGEKTCRNTKKTKTGGTINWLKIKWIRYEKAHPNEIRIKSAYNDQEFYVVEVAPQPRSKRQNHTNVWQQAPYFGCEKK